MRPPLEQRKFTSSIVDYVVDEVQKLLPGPFGQLFANCFPNTLDTTVLHSGPEDGQHGMAGPAAESSTWNTFVVTGDIPAMWLRDSMNQVIPFTRLVAAARQAGKREDKLERFLFGVVHRQASSVLLDAFANAFAWTGAEGQTLQHVDDQTFKATFGGSQVNAMSDKRIFERKFELDSLLSLLKLATRLAWAVDNETAVSRLLSDESFVPAVKRVLDVIESMRSCGKNPYTFKRSAQEPTDSRSHGVGFPCRDTGLIRSAFRGSDDSTLFEFNIPENAMAAVELARVAPLLDKLLDAWRQLAPAREEEPPRCPWASSLAAAPRAAEVAAQPHIETLGEWARRLAAELREAIARHGRMSVDGQQVYAYEVDGFGNAYFMDDANIPSLLALPYLGFCGEDDELYVRTRAKLLGERNPFYFQGSAGIGGIGGPHIGAQYIWPMSLMAAAFTTRNVSEVSVLLGQLLRTAVGNSLMHESFHQDNVHDYTRPWFAWANELFGDLVLHVATDPTLFPAIGLAHSLDLVELMRGFNPHSRAEWLHI